MKKKIAVNTRFLLKNKLEGFGKFTFEVVKRMAAQHPEHEFIYFFDRKYDSSFLTSDNITPVVLQPPCRHPILFKIWFNYSVTRALKKYEADVFFSPDGYLSLRTKVPQVGVIHDINFEHFPSAIPKGASNYLREYFPKFAHKAAHLITVSAYSKNDLVYNYGTPFDKITVAYNGKSPSFFPRNEENKIKMQQKYTSGNPYLLFIGAIHPRKNLVNMLQAFDLFKQRNSEDATQLLIVGDPYFWDEAMKTTLESMQFKESVEFTGHLPEEELAKVTSASTALLFVSYFEGFGIPIVEAFQSEVPVICGNRTSLPEVAGDGAYLVNPFDIQEIAFAIEQLIQMPQLRSSLVAKGKEQVKQFDWDSTAEKCFAALQNQF